MVEAVALKAVRASAGRAVLAGRDSAGQDRIIVKIILNLVRALSACG
jgi:hypothetical protein